MKIGNGYLKNNLIGRLNKRTWLYRPKLIKEYYSVCHDAKKPIIDNEESRTVPMRNLSIKAKLENITV